MQDRVKRGTYRQRIGEKFNCLDILVESKDWLGMIE